MILLEYQTIKLFLQVSIPNWSEEDLVIKKSQKILFRGHILLEILNAKKFLERFTKK